MRCNMETEVPAILSADEIISDLKGKIVVGGDRFIFDYLEKKTQEAVKITKEEMVSIACVTIQYGTDRYMFILCIYQTMDKRSTDTCHLCCYNSNFKHRVLLRRNFPRSKPNSKISRMTRMPLRRTWSIRRSRTILLEGGDALVAGADKTPNIMEQSILPLKLQTRPFHITKKPKTSALKLRAHYNPIFLMLMRSRPITSPLRRNLSSMEITPRRRHSTTSTFWQLILGETTTTFLRPNIVLDFSIQKPLLMWILKLWRRQLMVFAFKLPEFMSQFLRDTKNELVQYKATVVSTNKTKYTKKIFW